MQNVRVTVEYPVETLVLERAAVGKEKASILLLHDGGYGTTAELCWGAMIPYLDPSFRVVAPDLLGWGETDKLVACGGSPYVFRLVHLSCLVRQLEMKRVVLVGASFGGSLVIAELVGQFGGIKPIAGISISGSAGVGRIDSAFAKLASYEPSIKAAVDLTRMVTGEWSGLNAHAKRRYENSLVGGHWEALQVPSLHNPATISERPLNTILADFQKVTVPTLLIEGEQDGLLERGWARQFSDVNDHVRAHVMHAGHEPNISHPAESAAVMNEFLAEIL